MATAALLIIADSSVTFIIPTAALLVVNRQFNHIHHGHCSLTDHTIADNSVTHNTLIKLTFATIYEHLTQLYPALTNQRTSTQMWTLNARVQFV